MVHHHDFSSLCFQTVQMSETFDDSHAFQGDGPVAEVVEISADDDEENGNDDDDDGEEEASRDETPTPSDEHFVVDDDDEQGEEEEEEVDDEEGEEEEDEASETSEDAEVDADYQPPTRRAGKRKSPVPSKAPSQPKTPKKKTNNKQNKKPKPSKTKPAAAAKASTSKAKAPPDYSNMVSATVTQFVDAVGRATVRPPAFPPYQGGPHRGGYGYHGELEANRDYWKMRNHLENYPPSQPQVQPAPPAQNAPPKLPDFDFEFTSTWNTDPARQGPPNLDILDITKPLPPAPSQFFYTKEMAKELLDVKAYNHWLVSKHMVPEQPEILQNHYSDGTTISANLYRIRVADIEAMEGRDTGMIQYWTKPELDSAHASDQRDRARKRAQEDLGTVGYQKWLVENGFRPTLPQVLKYCDRPLPIDFDEEDKDDIHLIELKIASDRVRAAQRNAELNASKGSEVQQQQQQQQQLPQVQQPQVQQPQVQQPQVEQPQQLYGSTSQEIPPGQIPPTSQALQETTQQQQAIPSSRQTAPESHDTSTQEGQLPPPKSITLPPPVSNPMSAGHSAVQEVNAAVAGSDPNTSHELTLRPPADGEERKMSLKHLTGFFKLLCDKQCETQVEECHDGNVSISAVGSMGAMVEGEEYDQAHRIIVPRQWYPELCENKCIIFQ